jgi:hypothetical protein
MMGQSERKVAVPCRIGECRFGECRLANVRLANKAGEMSPTVEGRISPAGEFFVSWFLFAQGDQKSRLSRRRERRDPRCLRLPPSSLRHLLERPTGLSRSSTVKVVPQPPKPRPLNELRQEALNRLNYSERSLGNSASSARPFFPAEINICTLLTNCVLSFTSVSALRYSHTKLRMASWTWR